MMQLMLPLAAIGTFNTTTWIIFAIAAFFALCAAVSYLIATNLESQRRTRHSVSLVAHQAREEPGGPNSSAHGSVRQLEWPEHDSGDDDDLPPRSA